MIREEICEKVSKSPDAVKKWIQGHNGPDDLETIQLIADYFNVDQNALLSQKWEPLMKLVAGGRIGVTSDTEVMELDIENEMITKFFVPEHATEKDILIRYYHILVDYIYDYLSFFIIIWNHAVDFGDYPFWDKLLSQKEGIFRYVNTVRLQVKEDTFQKMLRIVCEIISYEDYRIGSPKRWSDINPLLNDSICLLQDTLFFEDAIDEGVSGHNCYISYKQNLLDDAKFDSMGVGYFLEKIPALDVTCHELSNTLSMIFRNDFGDILAS